MLVEAYSVLTRLPRPHRADPSLAAMFLGTAFEDPPLMLPGPALVELLQELPGLAITGGAVYDALIGATAREAGATLITLDRRALHTYERIGCSADGLEV